MIRVQLGAGLVVLLLFSFSAVEREAGTIVGRGADELASTRARHALALGLAEWTESVERQRGLTREAAARLADGPTGVVTALGRQLGGVRAFVLDRDKKLVAESGETASAPPSSLPGMTELRPGTTLVRLSASEKILLVAMAAAADGRTVVTVRELQSADLGGWLAGAGEGALQLGLASKDGRVKSFSGGALEASLEPDGVLRVKQDDFRFVRAELYDDAGEAIELVGFGRIDPELGLQLAALLKTTWYALGAAGLMIILVVVPLVARLRTKERAMEGFLEDEDEAAPRRALAPSSDEAEDDDAGWSELARVSAAEPPLRPEDLVATESSRTLPPVAAQAPSTPPETQLSVTLPPPASRVSSTPAPTPRVSSVEPGARTAYPEPASPVSSTRASDNLQAGLDAYLSPDSTPPGPSAPRFGSNLGGGLGGFAPGPVDSLGSQLPVPEPAGPLPDAYALGHLPEFASEIHAFEDPLRSGITRGQGTSPPPRPLTMPLGSTGFAGPTTGFGAPQTAAASPITRGPGLRSSVPAPGLGEARPFDLEHYRLVYTEFVDNKRRLGESVDNVTLEGFTAKLRKSEQDLIEKHGCRAVRFQVLVRNRQVSLRPQLVR